MIHPINSENDADRLIKGINSKDSDGKTYYNYKYRSPISLNSFRYDLYRSSWDFKRVIVFETMILYSLKYGQNFFRQMDKMSDDMRMSKHYIRKELNYLKENGYISYSLSKTDNYKNIYKIDYSRIIQCLDLIFRFEIFLSDKLSKIIRNEYEYMFTYYAKKTTPKTENNKLPFYTSI